MANKALSQNHIRSWIQPYGPGTERLFAGVGFSDIQITGGSKNFRGSRTPVYRHDPMRPGQYVRRGQSVAAPDNNAVTIEFAENCGGIPRGELLDCNFTVYELYTCCADPSNFNSGWDRVKVYSGISPESLEGGDRTSFVDSGDIISTISAELEDIYDIGSLSLGSMMYGTVGNLTQHIIDGFFLGYEACGKCGGPRGGSDWLYVFTDDGNIAKRDIQSGWQQWSVLPTVGAKNIAATYNPNGSWVFLVTSNLYGAPVGVDSTGYVQFQLDGDGEPDFSTFDFSVSADQINDIVNWGDGFISVGDTGAEILADYTSTTSTLLTSASALNVVKQYGDKLVVMAGDAGLIYKYVPGAYQQITSPTANNIDALWLAGEYKWWIGTDAGELFFTLDGGETWNQKSLPETVTSVRDIVFATSEAGYVLAENSTGNLCVFATIDGGYSWSKNSPRLYDACGMYAPVSADAGVLIVPTEGSGTERANSVVYGGMVGSTLLSGVTVDSTGILTAADTSTIIPVCNPWTVGTSVVGSCDYIYII